jgi:curved DNA-binding protein CbpA
MECFGASIVALLSIMIALRLNQITYLKYGSRTDTDYYELMKLESSATPSQIKQQYKKLMVQWHPDKNLDCSECTEMFQQVVEAYDVLGDPEKREAYDSSLGYIQMIKSKTHELTEANFDRLVVESSDFWVIQVYISGDRRCEAMAHVWEETAQTLNQTARFGRINAETAAGLLHRLPYSIRYHPTVLTFARGERSEIFTSKPPSVSKLIKFIDNTIPDLAKTVPNGELGQLKADFLASDLQTVDWGSLSYLKSYARLTGQKDEPQALILMPKSIKSITELAFRHREYLHFAVSKEVERATAVLKIGGLAVEIELSTKSTTSFIEIVAANSLVQLYKDNFREICAVKCLVALQESLDLRQELAYRIKKGTKDLKFGVLDTSYHRLPAALADNAAIAYSEEEQQIKVFKTIDQAIQWTKQGAKLNKTASSLGIASLGSFIRLKNEPWDRPVLYLVIGLMLTAMGCILRRFIALTNL